MRKAHKVLSVSLIFLFILSFFTPLYNSLNISLLQSYNNPNISTPLQEKDAGHYFITSNWMIKNIIVDGNITSVTEWADATILNLLEPESPFNSTIYFKNNATHLAILCDAFGDDTKNASSIQDSFNKLDHFGLGFDTSNDKIRSNNAEDSYLLLANSTLIRWKYSTTSNTYIKTALSGELGLVSFGSSSKNLNAHEMYELLIPLSLLSLTPGQIIGIGSEFNLTISKQGWPYDNNINQNNNYPKGILYANMNTWGQLKLAQKLPSLTLSNQGKQGTSLFSYTNSSATAINSSDTRDFTIPVPTDQWGLSFTNQTFKDLRAPNISRTLDTGGLVTQLNNYRHMGFNVTNHCTLTSFAAYIDDSLSTDNISYRILSAIWDPVSRKPKPNTANILKTGLIRTIQNTVPYWTNVTNINLFLNVSTSNTQNNTFFITLWSVTSDDANYWYNGADSGAVDAGPAWNGWSTLTYFARDFDLKVDLIPISNTPTPTQVQMKVNGSAVSNSGNWKSSYRYTSATGKVFFNVTTKWPLAYNVSYYCEYNKTVSTNMSYSVTSGEKPNWTVNWLSQFPSNARNYQMNVTIPIDWNCTTILNRTAPNPPLTYNANNWKGVSKGGQKIVVIKNITNVALQEWFAFCIAPNYVTKIDIYRKIGNGYSLQDLAKPILITEKLHINGTISSPIAGQITDLIHGANLTIFIPAIRTCHTQNNIPPKKGITNFTDWVIADSTNEDGFIMVEITWGNGTEVGMFDVEFEIIFPTQYRIYVDKVEKTMSPSLDWFISPTHSKINITAVYNDTFIDKMEGISTVNASYRIINGTKLWLPWNPLDRETIGKGFYNKTLDVKYWVNGTYYIGINLNKTGYAVQEFNITLHLGYNTSIALKMPASTTIQSYYPDNLTIQVNYTKFSGEMLLSAKVNCRVNGGSPLSLVVKDNLFTIRLNSTAYGVGNYNITIGASQMGYYTRQIYINWTVNPGLTAIKLYINGSYSQMEFYYRQQMKITVYYNDTVHNVPIANALVNLTGLGVPRTLTYVGNGNYSIVLNSSLRSAGPYYLSLIIRKQNYQNQTQSFTIYARYNDTLKWSQLPPSSIKPFEVLRMAVNLSHDGIPVPGQNITFRIISNIRTENHTARTNTSGVAVFNVGYTIQVGETSLSAQAIYGGNSTEFPAFITRDIGIIYHTRTDVFIDKRNITGTPLIGDYPWFIGTRNLINITLFYYNSTVSGTKVGISTPSATYRIINQTGGTWIDWTPLEKETLGVGYYNITLNVENWRNDTYYIGIHFNKTLFQVQDFTITIHLEFNTTMILVAPSSPSVTYYYPENLTIQVNYTKIMGNEILSANVRLTINGGTPLKLHVVNDLFVIRLNSTDYGVGNYNITIIASLLGYYTRQIYINWTIRTCLTSYILYINGSYSPTEFYYGQQMKITVYYNDTVHNVPITNALVNITLLGGNAQTLSYMGNGNYSIIFNSASRLPGLWSFSLIIRKPNYLNHTFNLVLYARYNTTLRWLTVFPTQAKAGQTLTFMVKMIHNDGSPVNNQNITFIVYTNKGPQIIPPIYTNGSGIASYDYVILSGVKTISVVAVFGGNLTEFSSSITSGITINVTYGGFLEQYWWIFPIAAVLLIVVAASARSRRKATAIKTLKKKEIMSSFQDVTKILHLVVIHKGSGSDIFDYKVQERMDPTLLAGFIQAVKEFGRELDQGGAK